MTPPAGGPTVSADVLGRHLLRMRAATVAVLLAIVAAGMAGFALSHRDPGAATPLTVTLVAYAAALWLGITATRDARSRMAVIRRAYRVHGDAGRLLADHLRGYLVILLRLGCIAGCALIVTVWGTGAAAALPLDALAALLVGMTWPTEHKSRLLLRRAQAESDDAGGATSGG